MHRPWLWRWQKLKDVLSNVNSQSRWWQREHALCNKNFVPFWVLLLALRYLPDLLNSTAGSEELIALAKMWSNQPFLPSLFPHDPKKAGKAVRHYLACFDRKRKYESIVVCPP